MVLLTSFRVFVAGLTMRLNASCKEGTELPLEEVKELLTVTFIAVAATNEFKRSSKGKITRFDLKDI